MYHVLVRIHVSLQRSSCYSSKSQSDGFYHYTMTFDIVYISINHENNLHGGCLL
jgi:hypothetical protein